MLKVCLSQLVYMFFQVKVTRKNEKVLFQVFHKAKIMILCMKNKNNQVNEGLMVIGYWLLVIGYWLLVIGYWLLVIGYWLLVIGYWLLAVSY